MADRLLLCAGRLACASFLVGAAASAQQAHPAAPLARLVIDSATRVADPKLTGGEAVLDLRLEPVGVRRNVTVQVLQGGAPIDTLWQGTLHGGAPALQIAWDGRDAFGARCDTGAYTLRVTAPRTDPVELPLDLVRLGITEIEAQDAPAAGVDEFQMVYFRKGSNYAFYATPAIHEYVNVAVAEELSDLDLDDGEPRPVVTVHADTATPVVAGGDYATTTHNYPLAYVKGTSPQLELTFGAGATSASVTAMDVGLPLAGLDIRVTCDDGVVRPGAELVQPGGTALVDLAPLPGEVARVDRDVTFRFEYRPSGQGEWAAIPGALTIPLRFYTLLGPPNFRAAASGTQYAGPWVEVADHVATWKQVLGLPAANQPQLTALFVHGFFGQNGGLATPIEDVLYDAYPLGGDGGATHYFDFPPIFTETGDMRLSRLLHGHALGRYINCSDNMGATTTMLAMLGASNMRPVRLGNMSLRALWGIGAPGYTLNLWGGGNPHSFSYHHIVTDDNAVTVSDTCMQLDGDGTPTALPSEPGWNTHRPWAGAGGYMDLAANNIVSKSLEQLPGVK
jgi:hypothetical protein